MRDDVSPGPRTHYAPPATGQLDRYLAAECTEDERTAIAGYLEQHPSVAARLAILERALDAEQPTVAPDRVRERLAVLKGEAVGGVGSSPAGRRTNATVVLPGRLLPQT